MREIEDEDIFGGCDSLGEISFGGSREGWENIMRGRALTVQKSDLTVSTPKVSFLDLE
jgi:hypothetical protein